MNLALQLGETPDISLSVLTGRVQCLKHKLHLRGRIPPARIPMLGVYLTKVIGVDETIFHGALEVA